MTNIFIGFLSHQDKIDQEIFLIIIFLLISLLGFIVGLETAYYFNDMIYEDAKKFRVNETICIETNGELGRLLRIFPYNLTQKNLRPKNNPDELNG